MGERTEAQARAAALLDAYTAFNETGSVEAKRALDRAERALLDYLLTTFPLPEGDTLAAMAGSPTIQALDGVPDELVPPCIIRDLIVNHGVAFNRRLGAWLRFTRRYVGTC